jgi:hypothetical protein
MEPSNFRLTTRQLALKVLPRYRSMVTHLPALTEHIAFKVQHFIVSRERAIRIVVTRGDREWTITPDIFEVFSFQHGDRLTVIPANKAAQLPNTWDDRHVRVRPGTAIRVPSVYEFFEFKGFEIPVHLISLTGGGPETLDSFGRDTLTDIRSM